MENLLNTKNQKGFFDLDKKLSCTHPEHNPPMFLYIPSGKGYKHICPNCKKVAILVGNNITF